MKETNKRLPTQVEYSESDQSDRPASRLQSLHHQAKNELEVHKKQEQARMAERLSQSETQSYDKSTLKSN